MWIYQQSTGKLTLNGTLIGTGYAGHGAGKNNPAMQSVHNVGPLPEGFYTIGAVEAVGPGMTGKYVLPLTPDPKNAMFGRSGFFMHGDNPQMNFTASDGCMVFGFTSRLKVATSTDRELQVIA